MEILEYRGCSVRSGHLKQSEETRVSLKRLADGRKIMRINTKWELWWLKDTSLIRTGSDCGSVATG